MGPSSASAADIEEAALTAVVDRCESGCTVLALCGDDGEALAEIHLDDGAVIALMGHLGASLYEKGVVRWRN